MTPRCDANDAAARATRAWLISLGLAAEIDALRFPDFEDPVPAPGLETLRDRAHRASAEACDKADLAALLAEGDLLDGEPAAQMRAAVEAARAAAERTELVSRQLAQLAMGVSSALASSDRVERLDRAAVAVLHPPFREGRGGGVLDEGVELFARYEQELSIELGGLMCRALVDRDVAVEVGPVTFYVDDEDALHMSWPDGAETWPTPLTVREPAREAVAAYGQRAGPRGRRRPGERWPRRRRCRGDRSASLSVPRLIGGSTPWALCPYTSE